jgi:pyridoxamine 5'-phosphate oxidase
MIKFNNLSQEKPYLLFKQKYEEAFNANQKNIEAISIASFNKDDNEVDSRFVNIKFIDKDRFIFFSNYNSPKSFAFKTHNQISGLFYWASTNVQIRLKANIEKTSLEYNQNYFKKRLPSKNALAISSKQSEVISSYEAVLNNFDEIFKKSNLTLCPEYWGGFSFVPYYFEFWEGHESRINKRLVFKKNDANWEKFIIQP